MRKFFNKIIIITVVLLVVFWTLDLAFTSVYKTGKYSKEQWLMNIKNEKFDFGILGSSRAYTTIDVETINKVTNSRGVNLGLDGSLISSQALVLDVLISNGNQFDAIYLQVDSYNANEEIIGKFSQPRFMPFLKDPIVFNHFKTYGYKWYAYRYLPYLRYAEFNFDWGPHNYINHLLDVFEHDHDSTGSFFYPYLDFRGKMNSSEYLFDLKGNYKFINKIITLCESNGIKLVLFTAPYVSVQETEKHKKNATAFKMVMRKKGIVYLDYRTLFNNKIELFTDYNHLNKNGVSEFSAEMAKLISQ